MKQCIEAGNPMPWGWWLRADRGDFIDENGRRWESVRHAFWGGRLGFPPQEDHWRIQHLELLLRVLTNLNSEGVRAPDLWHDLFSGQSLFSDFYRYWLVSLGFMADRNGPLTDEGRAVMRMLQATRDPAWADLPFRQVVAATPSADQHAASKMREKELKDFEASVVHLPWVFSRRSVADRPTVVLTGLVINARMPTMRVVWTQTFPDEVTRDDFFGWLAQRVARWEEWGEMANPNGADALTQRLLALVVASGLRPVEG